MCMHLTAVYMCPCSSSSNSLHNLQMSHQPQPDQPHRQQDEDIFSIVGGCELGADPRQHPLQQARNTSTNSLGSAAGLPASSSVGNLSRMGDLPEEQPSRILFVRGLDASVSDEALVQMFEVCGICFLVSQIAVFIKSSVCLCLQSVLLQPRIFSVCFSCSMAQSTHAFAFVSQCLLLSSCPCSITMPYHNALSQCPITMPYHNALSSTSAKQVMNDTQFG